MTKRNSLYTLLLLGTFSAYRCQGRLGMGSKHDKEDIDNHSEKAIDELEHISEHFSNDSEEILSIIQPMDEAVAIVNISENATENVTVPISMKDIENATVKTNMKKNVTGGSVTFLAMGDVPYNDMEKCLLPFEMDKLQPEDGSFLIHLGDIRSGKPDPVTGLPLVCDESIFTDLADILTRAPMQPFIVPGDNGWLDCANDQEAFGWWDEHLFHLNERNDTEWASDFSSTVNRWDAMRSTYRPQFFSFIIETVLFIGFGLPGPQNVGEWGKYSQQRMELEQDNIEWLHKNIQEYDESFDAVVLLTHNADYFHFFMNAVSGVAKHKAFQKRPVLILEDAHSFQIANNVNGLANVMRIRTDDTVTPMSITVDPSQKNIEDIFQYDRRCPCSTLHNPTHLFKYGDDEECSSECTDAYVACHGSDRCKPGSSRSHCLSVLDRIRWSRNYE